MDLTDHIAYIATELLNNVKTNLNNELQNQITDEVIKRISTVEFDSIISTIINRNLEQHLSKLNFNDISSKELGKIINSISLQINDSLVTTAKEQITANIELQLANLNLNQIINEIVKVHTSSLLSDFTFPAKSIPFSSVNFTGIKFTGDLVKGGIIEEFGSTGIEDRSSFVQLTLMDHGSVFEGPIYSPEIQVKGPGLIEGDLTINGNLNILGAIPTDSSAFKSIIEHSAEQTHDLLKETLNTEWFTDYSKIIFDQIKENGLDLNRITLNEREIINGNQLGYHITDSNLQRVGFLLDLQTRGETLLSDTLYTTAKRVGINTLDPSATFVVWDEECEIIITKRKLDTGYIGTNRQQQLILGSNNKDNIILAVDGSVMVQDLIVGKVPMSSASGIPSHDAPRGQIMFNDQPDIGLSIGWVSLGGARWASFGTIE
jgi:hypothetical protein